jgi:hypothetical protein
MEPIGVVETSKALLRPWLQRAAVLGGHLLATNVRRGEKPPRPPAGGLTLAGAGGLPPAGQPQMSLYQKAPRLWKSGRMKPLR